MKASINILIAIIVILQINGQNYEKPLNILVLYETLCPDSVKFFRTQLGPAYDHIKNHINLQLIPFGKAHSFNEGTEFQCQHGPPECEGNRIQSCGINELLYDQDKQVEFTVCQMSDNSEYTGRQCAESVGIRLDALEHCVNTQLGTTLQLQAEAITHSYMPRFIPTIIYDGVFNQQLNDRSQSDFLRVVCDLLKQKGYESHLHKVCNY